MDMRREAREHRLRRLRETLILPLAALLIITGLLTAAWYVSSDQRGDKAESIYSEKELADMKAVVEEREQNFATLVQRKARITDEDLAELEAAVAAQEKYTEAAGNQTVDANRLEVLRTRLHVYRAESIREQSNLLEKEATRLLEQADKARIRGEAHAPLAEKAAGLLREALAGENQIAQRWVLSNLDDPGRRARLDIRLRRMEADPIWEKGRQLERQSDALVVSGDFAGAEKALQDAIRLEQDYALRFRDVRATEFDREARLAAKLDTVRSLALKSGIDDIVRQAQGAEAAREWAKAAGLWRSAAERLTDLINRFPQSVHASRAQLEAYGAAEALARAMPEVEVFRNGMTEVRDLLRKGDTGQAAMRVSALAARVEVFRQTFPKAIADADPDLLQLAALRECAASLGIIRESLVTQLIDLPGGRPRKMLRNEVSQALYSSVMGSNPSAKREPTRPVESITYEDAERFCARLGWLTGHKVRLPDEDDYFAAQGDPARKPDPDEAWSIDTSDGQVREVGTSKANPLGFHDLCGNVSEWVRSAPGQPTATIAGGDAQSVVDILMPLARVDRREASRLRGFRVVTEP